MANPFDQFDAPAAAAPNPFDQFDATAKTPEKPFMQRLTENISDIPRQVGLSARYGLEGVGDVLDTAASPFRVGMNAVLPNSMQMRPSGVGRNLANMIGLPQPQNPTERVVGDASRLMAGSALPIGAASKLAGIASGPTREIAQAFAANPLAQTASAAGAGAAGGYTREAGGGDLAQLAASVAGGVAAPMALNKVQQAGSALNRLAQGVGTSQAAQAPQIDAQINNALKGSGITLADLPSNMQDGIRSDVQNALKTGGMLSPDAVKRLADYRMTGTTPNIGTLTLDPALVTQVKNLSKLGVNSKDVAAQTLAQTENANNRQLIGGLNDLGAANAKGEYAAGQGLVDSLGKYAEANKQNISGLYNAAKTADGRAASLDPSYFSNAANGLLDQNLKGAFVPDNIRTMMNDFATGKVPLNIQTAEQFKTIVGNAQRGAADGNVRAALGHIREALDNTPLMGDAITPAQVNGGAQVGQSTLDAFNAARKANRTFMGQVEGNPALAAAMDNAAPDKFFRKFVISGPARDLESMLSVVGQDPAAKASVKADVLGYIKSKALSGAQDEVGNLSQSGLRNALNEIGDEKLSMLLSKDEINQLKAISRVASYEQFQPRGSAVNNSNTAGAALANILDRFAESSLLSKIPFGNALAQPAQNISVGIRSKKALDSSNALALPMQKQTQINPLTLSPAAFMGDRENDKNSLLPRP